VLFSQSPSLRALFLLFINDTVSFCICWKICLKGNKNHNIRCPLRSIRFSSGRGRRGSHSCSHPPNQAAAVAGLRAARAGEWDRRQLPALWRAPDLGVPAETPSPRARGPIRQPQPCLGSRSHSECCRSRWGSVRARLAGGHLGCGIRAWDCLLHQYWLE